MSSRVSRAESATEHGAAPSRSVEEFLRGSRLYGDDFGPGEISAWFRDEEQGYFALGPGDRASYRYGYHALNQRHGFRHLPATLRFEHVLGLGSAFGEELLPVAGRTGRFTIVEPAAGFAVPQVAGVPATYLKPRADARIELGDACVDLAVSFGVLHHIPNVSRVLAELHRCLRPGAWALLREPTVSMGDWRRPRIGLTRHERGIPLALFKDMLQAQGFTIRRLTRCIFPLTRRVGALLRIPTFNSMPVVVLDAWLSRACVWPPVYHPTRWWERLQPSSVFFVLERTHAQQ